MSRRFISFLTAALLCVAVLCAQAAGAFAADQTGKVTADVLNIRSGAGTNYGVVGTVTYGKTVTVTGSAKDGSGNVWYKIKYGSVTGYCSSAYITITGTASGSSSSSSSSSGSSSSSSSTDFESYLTAQGFPESYKPYLRTLHALHPNWKFTAQKLGIDWSTAVAEECVLGRNLIYDSAPASWKSMERGAYNYEEGYWYGLDGWYWQAASKEIIMHYLDPRNFLNDTYIFMFENQSYNPSYQTEAGVKKILAGSFMSGNYTCPDTGVTKSYSSTFMEAAKKSGVSPYHLASRCLNEQGTNGAPQSLGTVPGYKGYFNFFDVMAYATSTMDAQAMGAKYASTYDPSLMLPWTNQYKSIMGGSIFVGSGYITKGQNTLYLQKFDMVDGGNGYYYHQYMTCLTGQATEAVALKNAYSDDIKAGAMEFLIPIYNNMPSSACQKPDGSGSSDSSLKTLKLIGATISPAFNKNTLNYTATLPAGTTQTEVYAISTVDAADVTGYGKVSVKTGKNVLHVICTAENGTSTVYTITVTVASAASATVKGDVNGDGKLNVTDALLIMRYTAGRSKLNSTQLSRADYSGDKKVTVTDAVMILKKVSK
ncbi:MAG: SH3 domain-containing protein [Ruminococcus sp.]|nr:SH3 domain-containing protein [Ruminococcus sp.]